MIAIGQIDQIITWLEGTGLHFKVGYIAYLWLGDSFVDKYPGWAVRVRRYRIALCAQWFGPVSG